MNPFKKVRETKAVQNQSEPIPFPKEFPKWLKMFNECQKVKSTKPLKNGKVADLTISIMEKISPGMGIKKIYEDLKRILG